MTKAFSHMVTKQGFSLEWPCLVKRSKSFLLPHTPASESLAKSCLAETKFQFSSQNASSWTLSLHCSPPHQFWGVEQLCTKKRHGLSCVLRASKSSGVRSPRSSPSPRNSPLPLGPGSVYPDFCFSQDFSLTDDRN